MAESVREAVRLSSSEAEEVKLEVRVSDNDALSLTDPDREGLAWVSDGFGEGVRILLVIDLESVAVNVTFIEIDCDGASLVGESVRVSLGDTEVEGVTNSV